MFRGLFRLLQRLIDIVASILVIFLTLGIGGLVLHELFKLTLRFHHTIQIQVFCVFLMVLVVFLMLWVLYACAKHILARLRSI